MLPNINWKCGIIYFWLIYDCVIIWMPKNNFIYNSNIAILNNKILNKSNLFSFQRNFIIIKIYNMLKQYF